MRRDPAVSLRGALQILGHHDRPWLDRLNALLGGVVLAGGVAPAAMAVSAVWGWVDQKNEAASLVRRAVDAVSNRISKTSGLARHELVIAAHTTIVISAFFDALRDELGDLYTEAAFTDQEKVWIADSGEIPSAREALVRQLYAVAVPTPSIALGFEENAVLIGTWAKNALTGVRGFMQGLDLSEVDFGKWSDVADQVVSRYRAHYLELAGTVREFDIWAERLEHAATRSAMSRLESLLSVGAGAPLSRDLRSVVRDVNRSVLRQPVIDVNTDGYGIDATFPAIEDIFIAPDYRIVVVDGTTNVANEEWWDGITPAGDLELLLARHFSTPGSTALPLLLLGHPGSGKSLVTQVVAASLPDHGYTVVRVPLRRVDANASIPAQIQQALDLVTHSRVSWPELVDQSSDVIRVVLLDGLDELLQASTHDRAAFLHDVVEFQRVEASLGRPVAVVVTSRTLVADRVVVPSGTPVVKLEEFDEQRIRRWVAVWNEANASRPTRPMSAETALVHVDLACQPLLLLMLTLYYADPDVPADERLSRMRLYERLFDTFARREVTKRAGRVLRGVELDSAVERQLRRLSIAALGMFNRGRQDITEAALGSDLAVLERESTLGGRLLAEFFFIHSPEARAGGTHRSYEFLHATFGEYLVAARVVDVLRDTAEGAFGRRHYHEPDDDLLFALLSYQPLAVQQPVLEFVGERMGVLSPEERGQVAETVKVLLREHRRRRPSRSFGDYRPLPLDSLRAMAAYSANLVLLYAEAVGPGAALADVWSDDPVTWWRSAVNLWQAGLDSQSYYAMLGAVDLVDGASIIVMTSGRAVPETAELQRARLLHDRTLLSRLRTGYAIHDRVSYLVLKGSPEATAAEWVDYLSSWLVAAAALPPEVTPDLLVPLGVPSLDDEARERLSRAGVALLHSRLGAWDTDFLRSYVTWLLRLAGASRRDLIHQVIGGLDRSYEEKFDQTAVRAGGAAAMVDDDVRLSSHLAGRRESFNSLYFDNNAAVNVIQVTSRA